MSVYPKKQPLNTKNPNVTDVNKKTDETPALTPPTSDLPRSDEPTIATPNIPKITMNDIIAKYGKTPVEDVINKLLESLENFNPENITSETIKTIINNIDEAIKEISKNPNSESNSYKIKLLESLKNEYLKIDNNEQLINDLKNNIDVTQIKKSIEVLKNKFQESGEVSPFDLTGPMFHGGMELFRENLRSWLEGRPLKNVVDWDRGY